MVGLGEDVGDPDGDEPAVGETLVEGMGREMAVEDLGEAEFDQEAQQQGDVIDAFVSQFEGGAGAEVGRRAGGESGGAFVGRVLRQSDDHGRSPTKSGWKAPLYRRGESQRKIQGKGREHENDKEAGLGYN